MSNIIKSNEFLTQENLNEISEKAMELIKEQCFNLMNSKEIDFYFVDYGDSKTFFIECLKTGRKQQLEYTPNIEHKRTHWICSMRDTKDHFIYIPSKHANIKEIAKTICINFMREIIASYREIKDNKYPTTIIICEKIIMGDCIELASKDFLNSEKCGFKYFIKYGKYPISESIK